MDGYELEGATTDVLQLEQNTDIYLLEQQASEDDPMPYTGGGYYPAEG